MAASPGDFPLPPSTAAAWLRGAGLLAKEARAAEAGLASLYASPALAAAGLRFDAKKDRSGAKDISWLEEVAELHESLARERSREGRDLLASIAAIKELLAGNMKWLTPAGQARYGFAQTRTAASRFLSAVKGLKEERRRQYAKLVATLETLESEVGAVVAAYVDTPEGGAEDSIVGGGGEGSSIGMPARSGSAGDAGAAAPSHSQSDAPRLGGAGAAAVTVTSRQQAAVRGSFRAAGAVLEPEDDGAEGSSRTALRQRQQNNDADVADEDDGAAAGYDGEGDNTLGLEADQGWLLGDGEDNNDSAVVAPAASPARPQQKLQQLPVNSTSNTSRLDTSALTATTADEERRDLDAALAEAAEAARAAVAAIDAAVAKAGGDCGGWAADDHRVFVSLLTGFLSKKGRAASLGLGSSAASASSSLAADASPPLLLTQAEEADFASRVAPALPVVPAPEVLAHVAWYSRWLGFQRQRRAALAEWSRIRSQRAALAAAAASAADGEDTPAQQPPAASPVRPTSPGTRARLAAWREAKDAERATAAAAKAAAEAAARATADAAKESWRRQQRAALQEWTERKAHRVAWADRLRRGGGGGGSSVLGEAGWDAGGDPGDALPPTPEELAARAKVAIAAAAARRDKLAAAKAAAEEAAERRFGKAGTTVSQGTAWTYSYVAHDPEAPTAASVDKAVTQRELIGRIHQLRGSAAHAAPVASQQPSRGRSFAVGASGTLPSRATPAWMKR